MYAISPAGNLQTSLVEAVGFANSLLTLLLAAIVTASAALVFRQNKTAFKWLIGGALILIGFYFALYALVSVWVPVYYAFLPLTEFWMITAPILGVAVLLVQKQDPLQ